MNKKRMLVNIALAAMSLATTASVLSCNKTKTFKTESFQQFQNQKTNSHFSFIDKNIKSDLSFKLSHSKSFEYENNLNENIIEDEQLNGNEDNLITNEQEEAINQELEITRQQLLDLEKRYKKDSEKNSRLKLILIGAGISSAVATGLSIGVGTYFGITKSESYAQKRKKELEGILNVQKSLINQINPTDRLEKIFLKLMDIGFDKQLPAGIFDLFDTLLFEQALKNHITKEEKERFKNILKEKIKDRSKEIVNELLDLLKSRNIVAEKSSDNVINLVKNIVSLIIKKYLPDFVKATLLFVSEVNKNDNGGTSLLGRAIKFLLDFAGYNVENIKNFSKIIWIFIQALANTDNNLIKIIIDKISEAIDSTNLTFDFYNDLIEIIKKTITYIFAKKNSSEFNVNLIFNKIIPAFFNIFENVINNSTNSEDFVVFVNSLFINKTEKKPLYHFLLKNNKEIHTENESQKKQIESLKQENELFIIFFPIINFSFFTIINTIFKAYNAKELINKFLIVFLKPLIKIAKKYEEKQKALNIKNQFFIINGIHIKSPYNAIFRIFSLYSFLYYKYMPEIKGLLGNFISLINPLDPEKLIFEIIKSEWKNITDEHLNKILGEYIFENNWYGSNTKKFKIFNKIKEYAVSNDILNFEKLIEGADLSQKNNIIKFI
ncbi:hypothetical protein [Mycoplasma phocimorsus]|uniref:hypothetical protein n=1 Tax=Mycoplasma phocimorsus TaxID=3045839 RepID=UPI0024BFF171|nr:hypothetical protein [Mycoplasma phocimorsus]MDJ1647810.1 hypothetical protein [Mycoplasma phocimorsus]